MTPRLRAALLAPLALLLAACAGIPTSGPIQQGPTVAPVGEDPLTRVIAQPPQPGATPEQIVRGFQQATASADADYYVARLYLTPGASSVWDPTAGVKITAGQLTYQSAGSVVTVDGSLTAQINREGEYTVAAPGSKLDGISYGMARIGNEWRIATLPTGLVLGQYDIARSYRTYDLYYFTRDFATLVPAPITVPITTSGIATVLVRSLLAGAPESIAPSVSTAFPEGTKLALDVVPVGDGGVADVELSSEVLTASDETRQKLSAQLVWTLRQVGGVTGVRISANGQPLPVPGAGVVQPVTAWPLVDPGGLPQDSTGWAVDKRGVVQLVAGTKPGTLPPVDRLKTDLVRPAVSLDSTQVAGIGPDKALYVSRLADGATPVRRYVPATSSGELSRPSWDRYGDVWVVDRGTGLVMVKDDTAVVVPIEGLPADVSDHSVLSVAVSRDGTRIAMLVKRKSNVEPLVARIERDGGSVKVAAPRRFDGGVTNALDLAWLDSDTLAVLGTVATSALEIYQLPLGYSPNLSHTSVPTAGAVTLAAAPGNPLLVGAEAADGDPALVYASSGSVWSPVATAEYPVYPG
ncbi:MAG: hypothetical protein GC157_06355 [Frankiales bacterium]|nr:hypothetical protein [Frankiales bacterium]